VPHGQFRLDRFEKNLRQRKIEPRFSVRPARIPVRILGESSGCENQTYFTLWERFIEIGKPIIRPKCEVFITLIGASYDLTN
jgi:hypothetical protein